MRGVGGELIDPASISELAQFGETTLGQEFHGSVDGGVADLVVPVADDREQLVAAILERRGDADTLARLPALR